MSKAFQKCYPFLVFLPILDGSHSCSSLRCFWTCRPYVLGESILSSGFQGWENCFKFFCIMFSYQVFSLYPLWHSKPSQWRWVCLYLFQRYLWYVLSLWASSLLYHFYSLRFWPRYKGCPSKLHPRVISKFSGGNIFPHGGHHDLWAPFEPFFSMPSNQIGHITFETMRATFPNFNQHAYYEMLLIVIVDTEKRASTLRSRF